MKQQYVPAFSLNRQIKEHREAFIKALDGVFEAEAFIGGPLVSEFEKKLAAYLKTSYVIGCNSGTDALWMAMHALQIPKDAIVLTTPFSFIASSSEIVAHGAHPVFIDIEEDTFNINPQLVSLWLEKHAYMKDGIATHKATNFPVVGILPVDLFGQCADYSILREIADTWNLWLVEDCAQAIGARIGDQMAGTFGTIGTFSFYPTKNLGAFGDAGACVTDDPVLAERLMQVRHHGRKANYDYEGLGINSRLDAFQATLLTEKLPLLDGANQRRREIAAQYEAQLRGIAGLKLPREIIGTHVYHQYTMLVHDEQGNSRRQALEQHLIAHGVQTRIFYPQPLPTVGYLRTHPALITQNPVTDAAATSVLSLPMWPELREDEVQHVCDRIKEFFVGATEQVSGSISQEKST